MKECKDFGTERCFWQEKCTHLPGSWTLKDGGRKDLIMEENLKLGNQVKRLTGKKIGKKAVIQLARQGPEFIWTFS